MGLISDKLNEKIYKNEITKTNSAIAIITSYDHRSNTASIAFQDPTGGGTILANNVRIQISEGGITCAAPKENQKCWVNFLNGSLLSPVIVSFLSEKYYNEIYTKKTSTYEGAYLVDSEIYDIDTDIETTPMIEDWLDDNNQDTTKYNHPNFEDYINKDIDQEVFYHLVELDKYKKTEDGITNLNTKSTCKLKENGDIDIFVNGNIGIRVSPNTKTISFFGKTMETKVTDAWNITGDVIIDGSLTVNGKVIGEE